MNFAELIRQAQKKATKNESLATTLDLSPSGLSRKINGEVGWSEQEINKLLDYMGYEIVNSIEHSTKVKTLTDTLRIVLSYGKE